MEFTGERFIPGAVAEGDEISVEHWHRYHSVLPLVTGCDVLDIACGEGYGSALIAGVARKVVGVDIEPETIAHASEHYAAKLPNLQFHTGSATQIPLADASLD
jgi:O-antigen biosynthesis protein